MPATISSSSSASNDPPGAKNPPVFSDSQLKALAERVLQLLKEEARIEGERQGLRRPGPGKERR